MKKVFLIILAIAFIACTKSEKVDNMPQNVEKHKAHYNNIYHDERTDRNARANENERPTHHAVIKTSLGNIKLELYGNYAPKASENFIALSENGLYSRSHVHRVAKDFIVQLGDPQSRSLSKKSQWGKGGVSIFGKSFDDEIDIKSNIYHRAYQKGTVAMANNAPNNNQSQFFICLKNIKNLNRDFTIFGKVIDGFDVLDSINNVKIIPFTIIDKLDGIPAEDILIQDIEIVSIY